MRLKTVFVLTALVLSFGTAELRADEKVGIERAQGDDLSEAVGHYARARSLLIAALREFDAGYKLANPNALLNSAQWRATLVDRAQELDRVVDPQPRVSRTGVRFQSDTRLLNEAKK